MLPARTYSISIDRNWQQLYETIWQPEIFPKWASGLIESDLRRGGTGWLADGPDGPITIRFTPHNDYGVMDHFVGTGDGQEVHIPLRVIANGEGAEVMLTLFRQPRMTDEDFARDAKWITRDLRALKTYVMG
ncbi:polyketide cyclase [Sphingobium sp. CR2-8]|uniref:polyketide cyclase n=1 Tax=Sphingobium sp. CR2-8 TaxID=1306534 RepID=UPI002DB9C1D7|nr:polyketide cyclase [Sphingobium sp. CR2-8]MEC3909837.1 polyketide cyclase [Sphingobium sp. CR2-8]